MHRLLPTGINRTYTYFVLDITSDALKIYVSHHINHNFVALPACHEMSAGYAFSMLFICL